MDIDELLNRYFEGETSSEEERELRAFFTSGNVPDRLAVYTPMFTYLEEESRKERQPDEALIPIDEDILFMLDAEKVEEKKTFTLRSVLYLVSGIAASFLLLLSGMIVDILVSCRLRKFIISNLNASHTTTDTIIIIGHFSAILKLNGSDPTFEIQITVHASLQRDRSGSC